MSFSKSVGTLFSSLNFGESPFLETEIIETRNGTADFWLLPNLAESY